MDNDNDNDNDNINIIHDEKLRDIIDKYKKLLISSRYTKFLSGKRVIIVGPDDRLIGKCRGWIIESYDVIIRFNTSIEFMPFNPELIKDIGIRTDVIYQCPSSLKILMNDPNVLKSRIEQCKIRFINYQNGNRDNNYIQTPIYCYAQKRDSLKIFLRQDLKNFNQKEKLNQKEKNQKQNQAE